MRNISAFDALVFEYFACFYFTFLFFFHLRLLTIIRFTVNLLLVVLILLNQSWQV